MLSLFPDRERQVSRMVRPSSIELHHQQHTKMAAYLPKQQVGLSGAVGREVWRMMVERGFFKNHLP